MSRSAAAGYHGYLGRVLLHCLEVEKGDVDQVIAMDDGDQLPFHVVAFAEAQHLPQLLVLQHETHISDFLEGRGGMR